MTIAFHKKVGKAEVYVDTDKNREPFRLQNKLVFPEGTEFDFIHDGEQFLAFKGTDDKVESTDPIKRDFDRLMKLHSKEKAEQPRPQPTPRQLDPRAQFSNAISGFGGLGGASTRNDLAFMLAQSALMGQSRHPYPALNDLVWSHITNRPKEGRYHFAGTDEEPFLVRMEDGIKVEFDKGEDAFYDALVPPHIKALSELYNVPWRRQGDIFGIPLDPNIKIKNSGPAYIFGTRHRASKQDWVEINGLGRFSAVQGKITAPDHVPQKWKGWHVVGQTQYLHNPKQAD